MSLNNEVKHISAKTAPKDTNVHILINDVVCVYNGEDHEVNFEDVKTFEDVLTLNKKKPNILLYTKPALYSAFRAKGTMNLETYVNIGDKVKYKNDHSSPIEGNPALVVEKLELKSLGDMAVIIATLEGGDYAVTNYLKKV